MCGRDNLPSAHRSSREPRDWPEDSDTSRKQLIERKYRSADRFYLETDFSKGHLSEILRGKGSPTVTTLAKLAKALDIDVRELFTFPERGSATAALNRSSFALSIRSARSWSTSSGGHARLGWLRQSLPRVP